MREGLVVGLLVVRVGQRVQEVLEVHHLLLEHQQPHQHSAVVVTVVAVVEERDVPVTVEIRQREQELAQCAGRLGELEAVDHFHALAIAHGGAVAALVRGGNDVVFLVLCRVEVPARPAPCQMPDVRFGQLVVAEVVHRVAPSTESVEHRGLVVLLVRTLERLQRHHHVGPLGVAPAVRQLRHVARVDYLVELTDGARTLRDRHRH